MTRLRYKSYNLVSQEKCIAKYHLFLQDFHALQPKNKMYLI